MSDKVNLGNKRSNECCEISKPDKNKLFYPSMYISDTKLPLDGDEIDDVMIATVKLKFTGLRSNQQSGRKEKFSYDFDVHEIEFTPKKKKDKK